MTVDVLDVDSSLNRKVADQARSHILAVAGNARIRFDGFGADEAYALWGELRTVFTDADRAGFVAVVDEMAGREGGITVDDAVERRNPPHPSLVLIDPFGVAASFKTLGTPPFSSITYEDLIHSVVEDMLSDLNTGALDEKILLGIRELRARRTHISEKNWAQFLISIQSFPTQSGLGLNLWRLGMIPDLGTDVGSRLLRNHEISKKLSAPPVPASTLSKRVSGLGLRDKALAWHLEALLAEMDLTNPIIWTRKLLEDGASTLTFEHWLAQDDQQVSIASLAVSKFRDATGKPRRYSRLSAVEGSEILAAIVQQENNSDWVGKIGVEWSTTPANNVGVSSWLVEVIPPAAVRRGAPDWVALGSATVRGTSRKALVGFAIAEEDFVPGTRLTCRVTGLDQSQNVISFNVQSSFGDHGGLCLAESEEIQVGTQAEGFEAPAGRDASAISFPLATLEEAREGSTDWGELLNDIRVDEFDGLAEAVTASGKAYSVRFSRPLGILQDQIIADAGEAGFYSGSLDSESRFDPLSLEKELLELPNALVTARRRFFKALREASPKNWASVEFARWDSNLIELAQSYGATYKRALESSDDSNRARLIKLDVVQLAFTTGIGNTVPISLTLAVHPLRALWWAQYAKTLFRAAAEIADRNSRGRQQITRKFLADITPANFPFAQVIGGEQVGFYWGELTFGIAIHGGGEVEGAVGIANSIRIACGIPPTRRASEVAAPIVARLRDFARLHGGEGLSLKFLNDENGVLAQEVMRAYLRPKLEDPAGIYDFVPHRVEIYSSAETFGKPSDALLGLQKEYSDLAFRGHHSYLVPPLSLAIQPIDKLATSSAPADVSVVKNYEKTEIVGAELEQSGLPYLDGLVTRLQAMHSSENDSVLIAPTVGAGRRRDSGALATTHHVLLTALAQQAGFALKGLGISVRVDAAEVEMLDLLHSKSEWVLSLEQNGGVHLFEQVLARGPRSNIFILDYSVDGVDAIGDRITVTSSDSVAVDSAISIAMNELNLAAAGRSVSEVLRALSHISGRLALRLRESANRAKEIVGLAAVVMHLRIGNKLNDTLLIPVDEHPEIFHPTHRGIGKSGRRCDLLLVRLKRPGKLEIEFIEVKFRSAAEAGSQVLFEDVTSQLIESRQFVKKDVLTTSVEKIDEVWQWARFCSLLHYYADKSFANGSITSEGLVEIKSLIDKAYERREGPAYSASGYVVSTDATSGIDDRTLNGVVVKYLSANMLNHLGLTTASFGPEVAETLKSQAEK